MRNNRDHQSRRTAQRDDAISTQGNVLGLAQEFVANVPERNVPAG
ncbi:hypothetical protein RSSM_06337 [Rhodopirellula sallentina SM41]|uniref:Uncharacterized protein n=1 Tax=Rhodopirellula sallentina SM41 TaxID=1263870 RepID=M5U8E5_9BACT|nr:hypothetical protein RSSM_06337 [Rhodopirellula sallentina SM41]